MKRIFIIPLVLLALTITVDAQIQNASFENWVDTNGYKEPVNWNTSNELTTSSNVKNPQALVVKDSMSASAGTVSAKLMTKEIIFDLFGFADVPVDFAGILTNGTVNQPDISTLLPILTGGGNFDVNSLISGGSPFTQRPDYLMGNYTYTTATTDTFFVNVRLTKANGDVVAEGTYTSGDTTSAWAQFQVDLEYVSCDNPARAIVTFLSSASPNNADTTTVLNVDDVSFVGVNTQNIAPQAVNDAASTTKNVDIPVMVLGNDTECDGDELDTTTLTVTIPATNGTAMVMGSHVHYTPNTDFVGTDEFTYQICDKGNPVLCSTAKATVTVTFGVGITQSSVSAISVYPNPAINMVNFEVDNSMIGTNIQLFNLLGKKVIQQKIENIVTSIDLHELNKGIYLYQLTNEGDEVITRGKFNIAR